jgi:hypothetical protein
MKITMHDPKIEIMTVRRDKEKCNFTIESHGEITVLSDKEGDSFWVDLGERRYTIVNSNGCMLIEENGVIVFKSKKKKVRK